MGDVAVMPVVAMMVVTRASVGRDGEHRQHGGDGNELGE
jgi:hypothetical protein